MINLLPLPAKKMVRREQRLRFFSVLFLVLGIAAVVFGLVSLPTSILLEQRQSGEVIGQSSLQEIARDRAETEKELTTTNSIVEHLAKTQKVRLYSVVMKDIDQLGGEAVTVRQFVFDEKNRLIISGSATTRAALSEFRNQLEGTKWFKGVDLPLSNLTQESEADFTMTLTFK